MEYASRLFYFGGHEIPVTIWVSLSVDNVELCQAGRRRRRGSFAKVRGRQSGEEASLALTAIFLTKIGFESHLKFV